MHHPILPKPSIMDFFQWLFSPIISRIQRPKRLRQAELTYQKSLPYTLPVLPKDDNDTDINYFEERQKQLDKIKALYRQSIAQGDDTATPKAEIAEKQPNRQSFPQSEDTAAHEVERAQKPSMRPTKTKA